MHFQAATALALAGTAFTHASAMKGEKSASTMMMAGSAMPTGSSSAGSVMKHTVMVSDNSGMMMFMPSVIEASVGHMVEFMFHPTNHSVAQAAFDSPCMPMAQSKSMPGMMGFYSGLMSMTPMQSMQPTKNNTFTIMVNNTEPMWFYSSGGSDCQDGMVGVINPTNTSGQTLDAFAAAAKKATSNVSPSMVAGACELDKMMAMASGSGMMMPKATGTGRGMGMGMNHDNQTAMGTGMMTSVMQMTATDSGSMGVLMTPTASPSASGVKSANGADNVRSGSSLGLVGLVAGGLMLLA